MTQIHAKIIRNACRADELQDNIEQLLGRIREKAVIADDNSLTYHAIKVLPSILDDLKEKHAELIRIQAENRMLQDFLKELDLTSFD